MKRILATILSVMLVATLAISGTVAYLTDDESAVNVMTVGKVNVRLHEDQRELYNGKPTAGGNLVPFEDDKNMMPITNDGEGNDTWGLSKETNYVDKIVRVENIGESDAWVRVFVAIPTELDEDINENGKPLHWNLGYDDKTTATGTETSNFKDAAHPVADFSTEFGAPTLYSETQMIDGIEYNIYCFTRTTPLVAEPKTENDVVKDDWTAAVMVGFYLDPAVDFNDKDNKYYLGDKNVPGNAINFNLDNDVHIPVYVQAIQAEGFAKAEDAFATMPWNPWTGEKMLPETMEDAATVVNNSDELAQAIAAGKTELQLGAGEYTVPKTVAGKTVTISGTENTEIDVTSGLTYIEGSTVTFNGVTIKSTPEGAGYNNGFADGKYAIFNDCVIEGTLGLDYSCEFNNCTFEIKGNYYNVWTWGAGTATFNGCTFNCDGKALLVYANVLDNGTNHQTVKITDCTFNDNGDDTVTGKAAIEITNTYTPVRTYDVKITGTTVNGFAQTVPGSGDFNTAYGSVEGSNIGTNVWGNKCKLPNTQINVVIDGVDVY